MNHPNRISPQSKVSPGTAAPSVAMIVLDTLAVFLLAAGLVLPVLARPHESHCETRSRQTRLEIRKQQIEASIYREN